MSIVGNHSERLASPERRKVVAAVGRACALARDIQQRRVTRQEPDPGTFTKADRSPVTVADFGVQALLSLEFGADSELREIPILGEENAAQLRRPESAAERAAVVKAVRQWHPETAQGPAEEISDEHILAAIDRCDASGGEERFWALDPIDGTKGFLRGGQYAVALGLVVGGRVVFAVLGCPALPPGEAASRGCLVVAARGEGCELLELEGARPLEASPPRRLAVSLVQDPAEASFLESVEAAHSDHSLHAAIAAELGTERPSVRLDSQVKYAALARGDASIYLRLPRSSTYQEKIWDHAAGSLVVTEAGGTVTDARGEPLDFSRGPTLAAKLGIVATNGHLHPRVLAAVAAVVPTI